MLPRYYIHKSWIEPLLVKRSLTAASAGQVMRTTLYKLAFADYLAINEFSSALFTGSPAPYETPAFRPRNDDFETRDDLFFRYHEWIHDSNVNVRVISDRHRDGRH